MAAVRIRPQDSTDSAGYDFVGLRSGQRDIRYAVISNEDLSVDAHWSGTGYAAFRMANRNGRVGSGYPTNVRVGNVIASGGGGIPVIRRGNHLKGVGAVIDKDFASCLLAQQLNADFLIILTAVEKVALRFGTPEETWLDDISVQEAKQYMEEGHFAPGSMLPKVQAAVEFAESGEGRTALITLLQKAKDGVNGATGTRIIKK